MPAISNGERITSKLSNVTDISINLGETLNNMTEEGSIGVFAVGIAQEYHSTIIVVMKNIKLPLLGKISNFSFVEDAGGVRHFTASGLNSKVSEFLIGAYNYYRGARVVGGKSIPPGATFDLDTIIYQLYRP